MLTYTIVHTSWIRYIRVRTLERSGQKGQGEIIHVTTYLRGIAH